MASASSRVDTKSSQLLRDFKADEILCDVDRSEVGQGSFGRVFVGKHKKSGFVAIKCFRITGGAHEQIVLERRFRREYDAMLQSQHDNIAVVLGHTKWPGAFGIVMQYYTGGNLRTLLSDEEIEFGLGLILRMATETTSAIAYIHNCGAARLVHGDIKPENIFMTEDLHIILGDFGCAKFVNLTGASTTLLSQQSEQVALTPYYAAPERLLHGARPKKEQDAYSCAFIYFVMLTRIEPYQSEHEFWRKIEQGQRPNCQAIQDLKDRCSPNDREIVELMDRSMVRCWDQDPLQRPDMLEVRDDFQQLLSKQDPATILQQVADAGRNMVLVDPVATHNPTVPLNTLSTLSWNFQGIDLETETDMIDSTSPKLPIGTSSCNDGVGSRGNTPNASNLQPSEPSHQLPHRPDRAASAAISQRSAATEVSHNNANIRQKPSRTEPGFLLLSVGQCVKYNIATKKPQLIPFPQPARSFAASCIVGKKVYMVGGHNCEESCVMLNLETDDEWVNVADMFEARHTAAAAVVQGEMYVSGGIGKTGILSSSLVYDVNLNCWRNGFHMIQPKYGHTMCSIGTSLYCIGGSISGGACATCEHYDVRANMSTTIPSPNQSSSYAVVEMDGFIYVIGGINYSNHGGGPLTSVKLFEPKANSWRDVASLVTGRYDHCACALNGMIYAIGGMVYNFGMKSSKSVEVYNPSLNHWSHYFDLQSLFSGGSVVSV